MPRHPGSIDRHGTTWRIRLCVGGRRHIFTLDGRTDLGDVQQFAREKDAELRGRRERGLPGPIRFSELLRQYRKAGTPGAKKGAQITDSTKRCYATALQAVETFFVTEGSDPNVHAIRPGHIVQFLDWRRTHAPDGSRRKKPLSARGVAKDRVVLGVLFSWARKREIVETNPVADTDAPGGDKREPVILDTDQYEKLLEACDREARPMLWLYTLLLGETGVRCDSEALWIRWEDLDFARGLINVQSVRTGHRTKSGKSRRVPITPRLRHALRKHMARYRFATYHGKRTEWVFHHVVDRRQAKAGARLGSLRRAFANAAERAGLPKDFHQHDLRHRRVTTWLADGKSAAIVQKAMGHSTIRVTEGYAHLVDDDLLQLVKAAPPAPSPTPPVPRHPRGAAPRGAIAEA